MNKYSHLKTKKKNTILIVMHIRDPKQNRSINTKTKIVESGLKLFSSKGFFHVTTSDIAKDANVSIGIVYGYFKNKNDIFYDAFKLYMENIYNPIFSQINEFDKHSTIESFVNSYIDEMIKSHKDNIVKHEEMLSMVHHDSNVNQIYLDYEVQVNSVLKKKVMEILNSDVVNIDEKIHIFYNLVDTLCHEVIYHKHSTLNFDAMILETKKIICSMF